MTLTFTKRAHAPRQLYLWRVCRLRRRRSHWPANCKFGSRPPAAAPSMLPPTPLYSRQRFRHCKQACKAYPSDSGSNRLQNCAIGQRCARINYLLNCHSVTATPPKLFADSACRRQPCAQEGARPRPERHASLHQHCSHQGHTLFSGLNLGDQEP